MYHFNISFKSTCLFLMLAFPWSFNLANESSHPYLVHIEKLTFERSFTAGLIKHKRAFPYLEKAFSLVKGDKKKEALIELNKFLTVDPSNYFIRWHHINILSGMDNKNDLINALNDLLAYIPDFGPALLMRAKVYHSKEKFSLARADYLHALDDPILQLVDRVDTHQSLFFIYVRQNQNIDAILALKNHEKLAPLPFTFLIEKAELLTRLNQYSEAVESWKHISTLTTDNEILRHSALSQSYIFEEQLDYTNAFLVMDLVDSSITDSEWVLRMANLAFLDNRKKDSLKLYRKSLKKENRIPTRISAAEVAWQLKYYNTLIWLLEPVVKSNAVNVTKKVILSERLCHAYVVKKHFPKAVSCVADALDKEPNKDEYFNNLMEISRQLNTQDVEAVIKIYHNKPDANIAFCIANALLNDKNKSLENNNEEEIWFKRAYSLSDSYTHGLFLADYLLKHDKTLQSQTILIRLASDKNLTENQTYRIHKKLSDSYAKSNNYSAAVIALERADKINSSFEQRMRISNFYDLAGDTDESINILENIKTKTLSLKEQVTVMEYLAYRYHKVERYDDEIDILENLLEITPKAKYWSQLSQSYTSMNDLEKADLTLAYAIGTNKHDNTDLIAQRSYLKVQLKDSKSAIQLMKYAIDTGNNNPSLSEDLAYLLLRKSKNNEAVQYFKKAIDQLNTPELKSHAEIENRKTNIKYQIKSITRNWWFSVYDSISFADRQKSDNISTSTFRKAIGTINIEYQPSYIGNRTGNTFKYFFRALWANKKNSLIVDKKTFQTSTGISYKPLKRHNFITSFERLFQGGSQTSSNWMLRTSWSHTTGNSWLINNKSEAYFNLYIDAAKNFQKSKNLYLYSEARYGTSIKFNYGILSTSFLYLIGSSDVTENSNLLSTGLGMLINTRSNNSYYKGYLLKYSILLRLEKELVSADDKQGYAMTAGLKVAY